MQRRTLGRSGLSVSALALGHGSPTSDFGDRNDDVQIDAIHAALDAGIDFLDTADGYGKGRNEQLVARAIEGRRDRVILATKFGNIALPGGGKAYNGRPDYVRAACDASLARLRTDYIDLYYLHRIDPDVPIEETVGAMAGLVRAGKVRHLGLSEAGPASLERACRVHPITALQTEYSLWARHVETDVLPACRRLGIGFVCYSPLGRGLLTGTVTSGEFAPGDVRRIHPRFKPGNLERNLEMLGPIEEIAKRHGVTKAEVALAWLLAQPDGVVPVFGTKQRRYVETNVRALALALSPAEIEGLAQVFPIGSWAGERYPPGYFVTLGT